MDLSNNEKEIYSLENLARFVIEPSTFRELYNELSEEEKIKSTLDSRKVINKPFGELGNFLHTLGKEGTIKKAADILHKCYENWINEARNMRGIRKRDTLQSIANVFYQLLSYSPNNVWLAWAMEKDRIYFEEYFYEVDGILKEIDRENTPSVHEQPINHFCAKMPLEVARKHFKKLTINKSKGNNEPFLTNVQLDLFIKQAFEENIEIEKLTLNLAPYKEKLFLVKLFYQFYELGIEYEGTSQCQDKYIRLLTDNFTNWDYDNIKNNFGNKVQKVW